MTFPTRSMVRPCAPLHGRSAANSNGAGGYAQDFPREPDRTRACAARARFGGVVACALCKCRGHGVHARVSWKRGVEVGHGRSCGGSRSVAKDCHAKTMPLHCMHIIMHMALRKQPHTFALHAGNREGRFAAVGAIAPGRSVGCGAQGTAHQQQHGSEVPTGHFDPETTLVRGHHVRGRVDAVTTALLASTPFPWLSS